MQSPDEKLMTLAEAIEIMDVHENLRGWAPKYNALGDATPAHLAVMKIALAKVQAELRNPNSTVADETTLSETELAGVRAAGRILLTQAYLLLAAAQEAVDSL